MPEAYPLPSNLSPATVTNVTSLVRIVALGLISAAAIASRLFAVINFESIIHELYVGNGCMHSVVLLTLCLCVVTHGSISECYTNELAGSYTNGSMCKAELREFLPQKASTCVSCVLRLLRLLILTEHHRNSGTGSTLLLGIL